ncbi:NCS2 family permease [Georgenia sp. 311]|uniref:NCS2 family permease n=1 Tax=Georgenia wutianyii TaxID=2585135 RepID=A0ABX5VNW0_9MICO|nr:MULTISPECIES: NCS2 family permease [Georgenia]QDB78235.1 NCS2 family permease [Georgenia wutianyii]TNC16866.1 NCS2 family permease [Georgenia sp. 311]
MSTTAPTRTHNRSWLDRHFQISERGSTVGREIRGGIVTFFAMSYILVLNPLILSTPDSTGAFLGGGTDGPNFAAVAAGTALVAGLMSILMGAVANFPLALAAGLGLNAVVAYTIVGLPGMTWADAMGIVVLEGLLILVLVLTGLREAVFRAVPQQLKVAISVGLGLFIALIGLVNAGIVRPGGTPLELGHNGSIVGWPSVVFIVGLFLILILFVKKVRGAILIGVVVATILAGVIEAVADVGLRADGDVGGWGLTVPAIEGSIFSLPEFLTLGQFSLVGAVTKLGIVSAALLIFSLMLADFFDTMGTMVAVGSEAGLLDEEGNPPRTRSILIVDSVAAAAGGAGGVSSNTSYIESAAGVGDGGRTGLTSVVTGIAFLLSIFLAPLAQFVPYEAATPALVVVGFLMMQQVTDINWRDLSIAVPAFLTIILMPFSYSISVGIGAGFIAYVVLAAAKKGGARKVHWLMWAVAVLFVIYFALGPIQDLLGL